MVDDFYPNVLSMFIFFAIILATCLLTSTLGLFFSVLCRKTAVAMILTYLVMLALFLGPMAAAQFLRPFTTLSYEEISQYTISSPFSAIFAVPLHFPSINSTMPQAGAATASFPVHWVYLGFSLGLSSVLLVVMDLLFRLRWRAASQGAAV
jgi:hypothetical protein